MLCRISFLSCCLALWSRPDLLSSSELWGELTLTAQHVRSPEKRASLKAWLTRRRGGIQALYLHTGTVPGLPQLLASLHGGPLKALELGGSVEDEALQQLPRLQELAWLRASACGLASLPPALPTLESLDISFNAALADNEAAALQALPLHYPSLTQLDLSGCGLAQLPRGLSALSALADLSAGGLDEDAPASAFEPLAALAPTLTRLDLRSCHLVALPPQLAALSQLRQLELSENSSLGKEGGLELLTALPSLRYLGLSSCGLSQAPFQLSALTGLEGLDLGGNDGLGGTESDRDWGAEALVQLAGSLTRLSLYKCGLRRAPPHLAFLRKLRHLSLWGNSFVSVGPGEVLPLVQGLTALTLLDIGGCGLDSSSVSQLAATGVQVLAG